MENTLPKLAIVGYGMMGKEVEALAKNEGFIITDIFEVDSPISESGEYEFDVAIDFSYPESVLDNIKILAKHKKSIVAGTTGWDNYKDEVEEIVKSTNIGLVYGSNFSIGMQFFFKIVQNSARLLNKIEGYDIMLHELHHHRKKDSPSGTALTIANIITDEYNKKTMIMTETIHGRIKPEMLHVTSTRGGEITGVHNVYIDSFADTIELTHRAKNRSGFAMGALTSAKWIWGRKGFYNFNEVLSSIWGK